MIPLNDLNPTRRTPVLTVALLLINILVFLWQLTLSESQLQETFMLLSVVPANISAAPWSGESLLDMVRSMFFHGSWGHLIGNMLYLYLFADNVEDRLGRPLFLVLYFGSGLIAALAQIAIDPRSTIPLVGASGAIAGVLGSYLVLFPSVRVQGIIPIGYYVRSVQWPAWSVLLLWFGLQLFSGVASLGVQTEGGVAFFAHIGGFVLGVAFTGLLMFLVPQPPPAQRSQMLYERARRYRI